MVKEFSIMINSMVSLLGVMRDYFLAIITEYNITTAISNNHAFYYFLQGWQQFCQKIENNDGNVGALNGAFIQVLKLLKNYLKEVWPSGVLKRLPTS